MRVIKENKVLLVRMDDGNTYVFDKECTDPKEFECSVFNETGAISQCRRLCADLTGCKFCKGDYRE